MKKILFLSILTLLFAVNSLSAETIFFTNTGKWNPWGFTKMLVDDLKVSKIGDKLKYTESDPYVENGDILIRMLVVPGSCNDVNLYCIILIATEHVVTDNSWYDNLLGMQSILIHEGSYYKDVRDFFKWVIEVVAE